MNVYDTANKLAQEIKSSEEFENYKSLKEKVNSQEELKNKIAEFEKVRYDLQIMSMQGQQADANKAQEIQSLYLDLIKNEEVKSYFDAELKFNVLLADINKIIGEAVKDLIS